MQVGKGDEDEQYHIIHQDTERKPPKRIKATEHKEEPTCLTMNGSSARLNGSVKIVRKPFMFP